MLKNINNGRFGLEGELFFDLFKSDIKFFASKEDIKIGYIEKCAKYLNSLPNEVIEDLCIASIKYCNDFLNMIGEEIKEFEQNRDILSMVQPRTLIIPRPKNGDEPVIHLELNCEWEEEHGMEWIIRGNKVLYVGSFNGENPWGDYSVRESWNYA